MELAAAAPFLSASAPSWAKGIAGEVSAEDFALSMAKKASDDNKQKIECFIGQQRGQRPIRIDDLIGDWTQRYSFSRTTLRESRPVPLAVRARRRNDVRRMGVAKPARRLEKRRRVHTPPKIGRCCEGNQAVDVVWSRSTHPIYIIPATHPAVNAAGRNRGFRPSKPSRCQISWLRGTSSPFWFRHFLTCPLPAMRYL